MYIKWMMLFVGIAFGAASFAQSLGFLQQDSPYDSLRKSDRFPVLPAISMEPSKVPFERFMPWMDVALKTSIPLEGKVQSGFLHDYENPHLFLRLGFLAGYNSNLTSLNNNGLSEKKQPRQWTPNIRFGVKPTKYFNAQIGFDRNFYGEGARSLFLSDFGKPYPFASTRFNVGPINYQAMLAYLFNNSGQQKFHMSHFIHASIGKRIDLQLFEAVVFNSGDTISHRSFDPSYLNPFVVIRPQEYAIGSGDNVLLGIGASFKLSKRGKLYGQFVMDDFLLDAFLSKSKYWGNKFAGQLGWKHQFSKNQIKYLTRIEANTARPYTFSHLGDALSYTHGSQALAHPLGANFWEVFAQCKMTKNTWSVLAEVSFGEQGVDSSAVNFGGNIYLPYTNRPYDYGISLLQGKSTFFHKTRINISYGLKKFFLKEVFCEVVIQHFKSFSASNTTVIPFVGIRTPIFSDYRF
jgi:hypothetical protein